MKDCCYIFFLNKKSRWFYSCIELNVRVVNSSEGKCLNDKKTDGSLESCPEVRWEILVPRHGAQIFNSDFNKRCRLEFLARYDMTKRFVLASTLDWSAGLMTHLLNVFEMNLRNRINERRRRVENATKNLTQGKKGKGKRRKRKSWKKPSINIHCVLIQLLSLKKDVNRDSHIASSPISHRSFFKGVRCSILASSQRKLRGYVEFL